MRKLSIILFAILFVFFNSNCLAKDNNWIFSELFQHHSWPEINEKQFLEAIGLPIEKFDLSKEKQCYDFAEDIFGHHTMESICFRNNKLDFIQYKFDWLEDKSEYQISDIFSRIDKYLSRIFERDVLREECMVAFENESLDILLVAFYFDKKYILVTFSKKNH